MTTRVLQADLAEGFADRSDLARYAKARVLVRYSGRVVGEVMVPIEHGVLSASTIRLAAMRDEQVRERISDVVIDRRLMLEPPLPVPTSWSVVVCTRDRAHMLSLCLESLVAVTKGLGEIIVVDNAPSTDETERLVERYPAVRYVREEMPGLNRARMRGAQVASGDIVIYTDDDTVAEEGWIQALLREFSGSRIGCVTGMTMPYELETEAQELFEMTGGFCRGFDRRVFDSTTLSPARAGAAGSGANMAFRRDLVLLKGLFDCELDMGTPARTGGDTYAFSRLLADGYRVVYTPDALNWHRHRRDRADMLKTMSGYFTGMNAFLTKRVVEEQDMQALKFSLSFLRRHLIRELVRSLARRPNHYPMDLVVAELKGALRGPLAYVASRRAERSRPPARLVVARRATR